MTSFAPDWSDRFWSKVHPEALSGCWLYHGAPHGLMGYGRRLENGHQMLAHRVAWTRANGPIPDGLFVCHRCDVPACVNPDHLFVGTHQDNIDDCVAKGRTAKGDRNGLRLHPERRATGDRSGSRLHPEKRPRGPKPPHWRIAKGEGCGSARLTEAAVREARSRAEGGESFRSISRHFGVRHKTIIDAIRGVTWAHVVGIVLTLFIASAASAQSDALMLARTAVSERGWRTETDDMAAIADVVRWRMERSNMSFAAALRALSPRLHHPDCRVSRRWLCELDEDAERPAHLGHARWEGMRRDAWLATLAEARDIVAGLVPSPCLSPAHVWGSDEDTARRERAGFRFVAAECPGATFVNRFGFLYRRIEE